MQRTDHFCCFEKVEAGKLVLEVKEFDIETELTNLIEVFSVTCDTKGLHLALELSGDCCSENFIYFHVNFGVSNTEALFWNLCNHIP